jgi:membrane-bound ClpP family serine protease
MRLGASLLLIAVGAILRFAVTVHNPHGFNVHTAGVILMIVGAIGLVVTAIWMSTRRRTEVVHERPAQTSRTTTYSDPPPAY